jgi:hypothetical protein
MHQRSILCSSLVTVALVFAGPASALTASQLAKLTPSDLAAGDKFGQSVAVSGNLAVVGAHEDDATATNQGSAYIFEWNGSAWVQQAKLVASDAAASDRFGRSVAISGTTVVIGAADDNGPGGTPVLTRAGMGSAYVFVRSGSTWLQQAKLLASDGAAGDNLGFSVAIDGDTIVAGSPLDDGRGSAYVFVRSGSAWTQQAKLLAGDPLAGDRFGNSVAVSGGTALVGATQESIASATNVGKAYAFVRSGSSWLQQAKFVEFDGVNDTFSGNIDSFGWSVALDGDTAVVGAVNEDHPSPTRRQQGSAYVYTRSGGVWTKEARLVASDGATGDTLGASVAVSGDTVVAGAHGDEDTGLTGTTNHGSTYAFVRCGGAWMQQARVTADDKGSSDRFGTSIALHGDSLFVGAPEDDAPGTLTSDNRGSAYAFEIVNRDSDCDSVFDQFDNCPATANPDQADNDLDAAGDACDADDDNDGVLDGDDNCPFTENADQADFDGDGEGDVCDGDVDGDTHLNAADNCPWVPNLDQLDTDGDGEGDDCDVDDDADGVLDTDDNCSTVPNADQLDTDADGLGDACDADDDGDTVDDAFDNCPLVANTDQTDSDGDGAGDACDADDDNDGVLDGDDNCPLVGNPGQADNDGDGLGDACDADDDNDGVLDGDDNCQFTENTDQADSDGDGAGDACDADDDNDGVLDASDNCQFTVNPGQADLDGDGLGDVCDGDVDGDGHANEADNCPENANADQADQDGDGLGDACDPDLDGDGVTNGADNCPFVANPGQSDNDGDGLGDTCDADDDNDGTLDGSDNCPLVANADQADFDGDGLGDACDGDSDADGVANAVDECPFTPLGTVVDPTLGCSIAQLVPCEGPRGTSLRWRNHGKYVSTLAQTAQSFVSRGLITETQKGAIVAAGAASGCGQ